MNHASKLSALPVLTAGLLQNVSCIESRAYSAHKIALAVIAYSDDREQE